MQHLFFRSPTMLAFRGALVVATACDSERAMAPVEEAPPIDARIALQFTEGLDASLEDAAARLAPSLGDEHGPTTLRSHLSELSTYLAAGDTAPQSHTSWTTRMPSLAALGTQHRDEHHSQPSDSFMARSRRLREGNSDDVHWG